MKVSWDDEIPNTWKVIKFHGSSHHQAVITLHLLILILRRPCFIYPLVN